MLKFLQILIFSLYSLTAFAKVDVMLECDEVSNGTATGKMEVLISEKEFCLGDTSGEPSCASLDGKPSYYLKMQKERGYYSNVSVTEGNYYFTNYLANNLFKEVSISRFSGRATVMYYDKKLNAD